MQRQYHPSLWFYGHFVEIRLVSFGISKMLNSVNTSGDMPVFYHYLNTFIWRVNHFSMSSSSGIMIINVETVCNFQSMKSPVELNSLS